jgi:hypothetical protein
LDCFDKQEKKIIYFYDRTKSQKLLCIVVKTKKEMKKLIISVVPILMAPSGKRNFIKTISKRESNVLFKKDKMTVIRSPNLQMEGRTYQQRIYRQKSQKNWKFYSNLQTLY